MTAKQNQSLNTDHQIEVVGKEAKILSHFFTVKKLVSLCEAVCVSPFSLQFSAVETPTLSESEVFLSADNL